MPPLRFLSISLAAWIILAGCSRQFTTPTPAATSTPVTTATPNTVALGHEAYLRACAVCHGQSSEGRANALNAPSLDSSEHASEHPDQQIHDWIVNGKLGFGREMPALGNQLTDEEVHAIIDYLHSLWTPEQLEVQQNITTRWPATPEPTWTPKP